MNHIKLFEEYSSYYKKIGNDYHDIGIAPYQYTEISDDIFNKIKVKLIEKKFNVSKVNIPLSNRFHNLLHPVDVIIVVNRKNVESNFISGKIKMTPDEWFYVQLDFTEFLYTNHTKHCGIYKCDQIEGLFKLFDELEQFS